MVKKILNLLGEIDKNYKMSEEGIEIIDNLQAKLEKSPTQSMKEKFESEMKKEIKKLQRLRDFFRKNQNNPDIKDKFKLDNGRTMIENEMERFREHEKEFKMKQYSKQALAENLKHMGNFVQGDDDSDGSHSYGFEDSDEDRENESDEGFDENEYGHRESADYSAEAGEGDQLAQDKEWLDAFIQDKLKKTIALVEQEADNIRNKKIRGTSKKQKDMLKALNDKLKLMRATREKCEELAMTMEFLEGGAIKLLKQYLKKYNDDHENDSLRTNVDNEVTSLIDEADEHRKQQDILNSGIIQMDSKNNEEESKMIESKQSDKNDKFGYLGWLNQHIDLSKATDIYMSKKIDGSSELREGMVVDAQDYLDKWHLSVICKIQPKNDSEYIKVNFLPYRNGKRDEWLQKSEIDRISGPFVNSDNTIDKEKILSNFESLRSYYKEKFGQNEPAAATSQTANQKGGKGKGKNQQQQPVQKVVQKEEKKVEEKPLVKAKAKPLVQEPEITQPVRIQSPVKQSKSPILPKKEPEVKKPQPPVTPVEQPKPMTKVVSNEVNDINKTQMGAPLGIQKFGSFAPLKPSGGAGMFGGPNPFASLQNQFQDIQQQQLNPFNQLGQQEESNKMFQAVANDNSSQFQNSNPMFPNAQLRGNQMSPPGLTAQSSQGSTEPKGNSFLDMLNSSFLNIPLISDQEAINVKCPLPVDEAIFLTDTVHQQQKIMEILQPKRYFPTSAMYNRQQNLQKMDLETLFFIFYYQQGTYQQYLAAMELKKNGWEFNMRFQTWIKKEVQTEMVRGKQVSRDQTIFFDYENEWKIKTSQGDFTFDDPKIQSQLEHELQLPPTPLPNSTSIEAMDNLSQEQFDSEYSLGNMHINRLPRHVIELIKNN